MKYLKLLLVGTGSTFLVLMLLMLAWWSFSQPVVPPVSNAGPLPSPDIPTTGDDFAAHFAGVEATARERHDIYQGQLSALRETEEMRRTAYEAQLLEATNQLGAYQPAINQLDQDVQVLAEQNRVLQNTLSARKATYSDQLQQLDVQLTTRRTLLLQQIAAAQRALAETNAQLGH